MIQILLKDIRSIRDIPLERPCWVEEKRWNSIQKIRIEADKKRSLVSAYLLDAMCRDLEINNPVYEYTEKGKPFLSGVDSAFNNSHSGDYVALAYHRDTVPVGVDIQQLRVMRDGMERRLLYEKEKALLPEEEKNRWQYLNRLWTIKESFVKMTGEGLSRDFRTVFVDFEKEIVMTDDGIKAEFGVWEWKEDYFLAVCTINSETCEIKEIG